MLIVLAILGGAAALAVGIYALLHWLFGGELLP